MIATVQSIAFVGMEARPVEVEVALTAGLPDFQIVGLPNAAVRDARQRVKAAVVNSEEEWPQRKITANLAPGDLRKEGAALDLPLAIGVLAAAGKLARERVCRYLFLGELALDGRVRPVRGVLAAALAARSMGARGLVVPAENAAQAALVPDIEVVGAAHLVEALAFANGEISATSHQPMAEKLLAEAQWKGHDLSEVRGQALARRALEIAAAGEHNVLMVGPPGSGKTMLARRLPGILPPMSVEEALEVTHVWSVAGLVPPGCPMIVNRPFRSPHHHTTAPAVVGGGSGIPRPGEVSLAHRGVLFMDEFPFFSRGVLESLRQPLEEGVVTVARQGATVNFPARASLVAAANPCMCRRAGDVCSCQPHRLDAYRARLTGPLLDRIDLHVDVPRLTESEVIDAMPSEPSALVRARVIEARRLRTARGPVGAEDELASLDAEARRFLRSLLRREPQTARGIHKLVRVGRTIADLEGASSVGEQHLAEAFQFRSLVWEA
jgi:magnesium chelatase family protein